MPDDDARRVQGGGAGASDKSNYHKLAKYGAHGVGDLLIGMA